MRIMQVKSELTFGEKYLGKWWCFDSTIASDGDPVSRYFQADGTWGKNAHYFDEKIQIEEALKKGHKPDFTISHQERQDRLTIKQDQEYMEEREEEADYEAGSYSDW